MDALIARRLQFAVNIGLFLTPVFYVVIRTLVTPRELTDPLAGE